eukprot:TRINITY_DN5684_c0_g4_i5.p1 TRINITY_DN5684_c0_g4~~TRINITY_DN5684_c0_g4_i5.p1  ORF type:complete len:499 (-),score=100.98 TRINITY_DN5684_c0_g4_i5:54-1550(-)
MVFVLLFLFASLLNAFGNVSVTDSSHSYPETFSNCIKLIEEVSGGCDGCSINDFLEATKSTVLDGLQPIIFDGTSVLLANGTVETVSIDTVLPIGSGDVIKNSVDDFSFHDSMVFRSKKIVLETQDHWITCTFPSAQPSTIPNTANHILSGTFYNCLVLVGKAAVNIIQESDETGIRSTLTNDASSLEIEGHKLFGLVRNVDNSTQEFGVVPNVVEPDMYRLMLDDLSDYNGSWFEMRDKSKAEEIIIYTFKITHKGFTVIVGTSISNNPLVLSSMCYDNWFVMGCTLEILEGEMGEILAKMLAITSDRRMSDTEKDDAFVALQDSDFTRSIYSSVIFANDTQVYFDYNSRQWLDGVTLTEEQMTEVKSKALTMQFLQLDVSTYYYNSIFCQSAKVIDHNEKNIYILVCVFEDFKSANLHYEASSGDSIQSINNVDFLIGRVEVEWLFKDKSVSDIASDISSSDYIGGGYCAFIMKSDGTVLSDNNCIGFSKGKLIVM